MPPASLVRGFRVDKALQFFTGGCDELLLRWERSSYLDVLLPCADGLGQVFLFLVCVGEIVERLRIIGPSGKRFLVGFDLPVELTELVVRDG